MSMHVTRGDLVLGYVPARPRPRGLPGRALMGTMIVVFLLAGAVTVLGRGASGDAYVDASDVLMQGP